jgi:pyruvate/2-oxoglutarate dehydrogenase complex dihydrolipoamide acyltransferase (E2) component
MPQLGESVAEGTIGKWLKQVGDRVDKYEPIVEVITDKVNAEVPSPFEGTLTEILVQEGETVPNNAEIAVIEGAADGASQAASDGAAPATAGEAPAATDGATAAAETDGTATATGASQSGPAPAVTPESAGQATSTGPNVESAEGQHSEPAGGSSNGREPTILGTGHGPAGSDERRTEESRPAAGAAAAATAAAPSQTQPIPEYEGRVTPAVRRLAREHGIDLALVTGTGHSGRVTREDVLGFIEQQRAGDAPATRPEAAAATASSAAPAPAAPTPPASPAAPAAGQPAPAAQPAAQAQAPAPPKAAGDELKPITPMRKAIAAHMVQAKSTAPHAYTTVEVDMSGVVALRDANKRAYEAQEGVSLSFVPFITKAVVEALRRHADLNAHWTADGLLRKRDINIGIAVAVDDGLIVPVIKNADTLSINGLNRQVQDLAARARANRLKLDDIQGGTFTVNNTGWFGSVSSQPIVNVPEVAILSMEAIVKRPVVIETPQGDTIGIRPIMNVCVSFDHRATDGAQIGRFVQDVRRWLESVDSQTAIW